MNRHSHRVVFNRRRGELMAVAETAAGSGKATGARRKPIRAKARTGCALLAAFGLLAGISGAQAQIVANPGAPGGQQATVLQSASGVPLVNIQTPNAAGVSMNRYSQFDVQAAGAILNNSRKDTPTQLGGWVQGNPWLATGAANVIVNQVESSRPSLLGGYTEVAGQRAGVVIANPSGISVNGGGFINASGVTLTTGVPQFGAGGALAGFNVQGGQIGVEGRGLDLSETGYAQLLARAVNVNAGIWANDLQVVTGANQVSADGPSVTPASGAAQGAAPSFALDVGQLGGMYAGKIFLVGTEAGLGVNNAGAIAAASGPLTLSANGKLTNGGTLAASGAGQDVTLNVQGLANGGVIASQRDINLTDGGAQSSNGGQINAARQLVANAAAIDNQAGGAIAAQRLQISAQTLQNAGTIQQTGAQGLAIQTARLANTGANAVLGAPLPAAGGTGGAVAPGAGSSGGAAPSSAAGGSSVASATPAPDVLPAGEIHAVQAIANSGVLVANGATDVATTQTLSNSGALNARALNAAGTFDNSGGQAQAQTFSGAQAAFINRGGRFFSEGDLALATGSLDNRSGRIGAAGAFTGIVGQGATNSGGALSAQGDVTLVAQSVDNSAGGQIASNAGSVAISAAQALANRGGDIHSVSIDAGKIVTVQAASLDNGAGRIAQAGAGAMRVAAGGALDNIQGQIVSGGSVALDAGALTNEGGAVAGQSGVSVYAASISNRGGTLQAGSSAAPDADLVVQATGAIDNTGGTLAASGNAAVQAASLDNTQGSASGQKTLAVATTGVLTNSAGRLQSTGDVALESGNLANDRGGLIASGAGDVTLNAAAVSNRAGAISAAGLLTANTASFDNTQGHVTQAGSGALQLATSGTLNNTQGEIASNGGLALTAGVLANRGGVITSQSVGAVIAQALDNASGRIQSGAALDVASAGALDNSAGELLAAGALHASADGDLVNAGGTILGDAGVALASAGLANGQGGAIGSSAGAVAITTGALANQSGTIAAGADTAITSRALDNSAGQIAGATLAVNTQGAALTNAGGRMTARAGDLTIASGALGNRGGTIAASDAAAIQAAGIANQSGSITGATVDLQSIDGAGRWAAFDNRGGTVAAGAALTVASAGVNNTQGTLQASEAGATLALQSHGGDVVNRQSGAQGGILSGGTLVLDAQGGAIDNSDGGYLGASGNAALAAARVVNRGGAIVSNADLRIDGSAAGGFAIDNGAGQIQALGSAVLDAGAAGIANAGGAVLASRNATLQSAGALDNAGGSIRAGENVSIADSGVAAGGALASATQDVSNTAGQIKAGQALAVASRSLTGDGAIESTGDLSVALASDYTQSAGGVLAANGNLSLHSLGNITNQGSMTGGTGAAVSAANVDNQAGAAITSAGATRVGATHALTNRGLIDGSDTRIDAATVNNVGTGRIYGDHVSVAAGAVNNTAEGGTAATLAARGDLDIGAGVVNNNGGATLLSLNDMRFGGALDAGRRAMGPGAQTINNSGSNIDAQGNIDFGQATVNNTNPGLVVTPQVAAGTAARPDMIQLPGQLTPENASNFVLLGRHERYPYVTGDEKVSGAPFYSSSETHLVKPVHPDLFGTYIPQAVTDNPTCTNGGADNGGVTCTHSYSYASADSPLWAQFSMAPPANYTNVAPDPTAFGAIPRMDFDGNPYLDWSMGNRNAYNAALANYDASIAAVTALDNAITAQNIANNGATNVGRTYVELTGITQTTYQDEVGFSTPGRITAGRNITVGGTLNNTDSSIVAGGAITASGPVNNIATQGTRTVRTSGTADSVQWTYSGGFHDRDDRSDTYAPYSNVTSTTFALPTLTYPQGQAGAGGGLHVESNGNGGGSVAPSGPGASGFGQGFTAGGGASGASAARAGVVAGAGGAVPVVAQYPGHSASGAALTVRTLASGPALAASSLYVLNAANGNVPLIETDPAFTQRGQWLSSDYMLGALGLDPAALQRRLGDGFYEQQLIQQQVGQLTGQRFIGDYSSNDAEYRALMDAGITYAKAQDLRPGIALSASQIAALTSDIVWLVNETVTLPDGSTQTVLTPKLYVLAQPGDVSASGALISGRDVLVNTTGDVTNGGTIAGRRAVQIAANDINDVGGRISGNQVGLAALRDINVVGGSVQAAQTLIAHAGRDLNVQSTTRSTGGGTAESGYANTALDRVASVSVVGGANDAGTSPAGGLLQLSAGRDITLQAASLGNQVAGGATTLAAGRDLNLGTVRTSAAQNIDFGQTGHLNTAAGSDVGSGITAQGDLAMIAGGDLNASAANVNAQGRLAAIAGGDIAIGAGETSRSVDDRYYHESHGFLSGGSSTLTDRVQQTQSIASSLGGQTVTLQAGKDITIAGSNVISDQGTTLAAAGDIAITAARDTTSESHTRESTESGFLSGGGFGITYGHRELSSNGQSESSSAAASTVGAIAGNVAIRSGGHYTQTGSDVLAPAGDIAIAARQIDIIEAREQASSQSEQRFRQSGITLALSSPVISALQTAGAMAEAAGNTSDARMQALAAGATALGAKGAIDAVRAGQGAVIGGKEGQIRTGGTHPGGTPETRDATALEKAGGLNVSISVGSASSESHSWQASDGARGSNVAAGGNVSLVASGAGQASNLTIQGSNVAAGNDMALYADNQINLLAAQETASRHSSSKGASGSLGVSFGTSGFGVTAAASSNRGHADGDDIRYSNTHVAAGRNLTLQSGGDTTLRGAVASAGQITARVGGNLAIESLQDQSNYDARQESVGGSLTIGAGVVSGSISASAANTRSNYRSVAEQSALRASDGGFDVRVAGATELKAGAITSTQAAIDEQRNHFGSAGLTASDLENRADYDANAAGVTLGTAANLTGRFQPSGSGAGVGGASGQASSTTRAAISGIAGDVDAITGQAESGVRPIFDAERVQKDINAQVIITQAFGTQASRAVKDYAQSERAGLYEKLGKAASDEDKTAIEQQIKDVNMQERALNILVGALTGQAGSAVTKESLSMAAEKMRDLMIEDSKRFKGAVDAYGNTLDNISGQSAGVRGDGYRIGGTRVDLDLLCGSDNSRCTIQRDQNQDPILDVNGKTQLALKDGMVQFIAKNEDGSEMTLAYFLNDTLEGQRMLGPTGGIQGFKGTLFGIRYESGSWQDKLIEAFAGTHDEIGGKASGLYDAQGNIKREMSDVERSAYNAWSAVAIVPAAPFAASEFLSPEVWDVMSILLKAAR